jgi:protoporphyrinogen oxidase
VGLLLKKVSIHGVSADGRNLATVLPDNWIYVQEPYVKVGRIQVFNNWSPYMVQNQEHVWLGLEYFANVGDSLWSLTDSELVTLGIKEMQELGFSKPEDCLDSVVIRMPKAYPSYFGDGYKYFDDLKKYADGFSNLRLLGRNGMHRYNNQDHSMLTAMMMVDNLVDGVQTTDNLWSVNVEKEYHETKDDKDKDKDKKDDK